MRKQIDGLASCTIVAKMLNLVVRAFQGIYKKNLGNLEFRLSEVHVGLVGLEPMTPTMSMYRIDAGGVDFPTFL